MKIMISGASGLLGKALVDTLNNNNEVYLLTKENMDITNMKQVQECTQKYTPDVIINSAGITNVDGCESNINLTYNVNALGAKNLALAAKEIGCPILYFSTDYIFDGLKRTPYVEGDTPNPLNVYGKSKFLGENMIKEITDKNYIIRTAWLYGKTSDDNFVNKILELSKKRHILKVVDDQMGSPTNVIDVAYAVNHIIKSNKYGTYHVVNNGGLSWYTLARRVLEYEGSTTKVLPIQSKELNQVAKRPVYSVLDNHKLINELDYHMPNWEDALHRYFNR